MCVRGPCEVAAVTSSSPTNHLGGELIHGQEKRTAYIASDALVYFGLGVVVIR